MTDKAKALDIVKKDIRSILITFHNGCTMNILDQVYREQIGKYIPFKQFGYADVEYFLKDMPDVVKMHYSQYPRGYILKAVVDESTQHIHKLVSKQKDNTGSKLNPFKDLYRTGGVRRDRTSASQQFTNSSWSYGLQQNKPSFTYLPPRLRITVKSVPYDRQICIKELMNSFQEGLRIENFDRAYTQQCGMQFRPTNYGFSDLKECLTSLTNILKVIPDGNSYRIYGVGVPEPLKPSPPPPPKPASKTPEPVSKSEESSGSSGSLKTNLRRVLAQFPGGLLLKKLLVEYERIVKQPLNYTEYGFSSALDLVAELNDVFYMERPSGRDGDWLLYDASKPPPPKVSTKAEEVQIPPENKVSSSPSKISSKIKSNIETVLLKHTDGVLVDQFETVYKRDCNEDLPWQELGYESITKFFLELDSSVQLLPCKSGNVIVIHQSQAKAFSDDKIPDNPFKPVLPGADYNYLTLAVEMCQQKYIEVITSQINNPGDIWIQLRGMDTTEELEELMTELEKVYSRDNGMQYIIPDGCVKVSMVCAVIWPEDKNWHRGKVTAILSDTMVEVLYVDYGSISKVERKMLRFLSKNFLLLPAQAIHARMSYLEPIGRDWSIESRSQLLKMCNSKPLQAYITSTTYKNTVSVMLVDTSVGEEDFNINVFLYESNLARRSKDDNSESAALNSFVDSQNNVPPISSSIGLADLSYQMQMQREYYWAQMNYMLSCSGMNHMSYAQNTQNMPEDKKIDLSVLQKMDKGAVKPLETGTNSSSMSIPINPGSGFSSNRSSPDSLTENLTRPTERNNEACGLNMPDIIRAACEQLEQKQYRYSQIINLSDYDVHLINFKGKPYMTSGDISVIIWGIDVLKKVLKVRKIKDSSITVYKKDAEDFFKDLEKNDVKVLPEGPSVDLFPIESVKEIIPLFHKNSDNIALQLEQLQKNFNSSDPYWTKEFKEDSNTVKDEDNMEKRLHELIQKRLKLLQDMIQTPKGDSVCITELQEVEEQIKKVEAEIRGEIPKENNQEPINSQKPPLISTMPVLHQNSASTHLGLPIRQIQSVRPTVSHRNANAPLVPQGNSSPFQLPLISMVPSMPYPPGMCYPLPYALQQNSYLPQNVMPGSWSTNN